MQTCDLCGMQISGPVRTPASVCRKISDLSEMCVPCADRLTGAMHSAQKAYKDLVADAVAHEAQCIRSVCQIDEAPHDH